MFASKGPAKQAVFKCLCFEGEGGAKETTQCIKEKTIWEEELVTQPVKVL